MPNKNCVKCHGTGVILKFNPNDEWGDSLVRISCDCKDITMVETKTQSPTEQFQEEIDNTAIDEDVVVIVDQPEIIDLEFDLKNHYGQRVSNVRRDTLVQKCIERMRQDPSKRWTSITEGQAFIVVLRNSSGHLFVFDTNLLRKNT